MVALMLRALVCLALAAAPAAACEGRNVLADRSATYRATLDAAAALAPFPEGRFFEVSRDGARSVLFGTMHLADPRVARVPAALAARIRDARRVFVEITGAEERRMRRMFLLRPSLTRNGEGRRISDVASEAEMAALARALESHGLDRTAFDGLEPWFLNLLATLPACATDAPAEAVLDRRIEAMARAAGVPVEGLEGREEVLGALRAGSYEEQVETLIVGLPLAERAADAIAVTRDLYLEGEIFKIWLFGRMEAERLTGADPGPVFRRMYRRLVTERNRRWMVRLLPALHGGDVVVAVGALHLGGPSGLLPMLEAEGFEVRRLAE